MKTQAKKTLLLLVMFTALAGCHRASYTMLTPAAKDSQTVHTLGTPSGSGEVTLNGITAETDLSFLDAQLVGKRVIYLGEADHFVDEKYNYRLLVIRYLFQKGWTTVGMEMGHSDGSRLDKYLATGDGAWLNKMALYGYRGAIRTDRDDAPKGFLKIANPKFPELFRSEEKWFAGQLLSFSNSANPDEERVHFFGYDVDTVPGGGYEDLGRLFAAYKNTPPLRALKSLLARVPNETAAQEASRLQAAFDFMQQHRAEFAGFFKKSDFQEIQTSLACLKDSFHFTSVQYQNPDPTSMMKAYAQRETTMFRQVDEVLTRLGPQSKIILMGHNMHLSKRPELLSFSPQAQPKQSMWPSVGQHIFQELKNQVLSIWMIDGGGFHSDIQCPQDQCRTSAGAQDISQLLAPLGDQFFAIPPMNGDFDFLVNGGTYSGEIGQNADVVFFVKQTHGLRLRN